MGNESAVKAWCDDNGSGVLEGGVGMIWFHVKVQALPRARTLNMTVLVGVAGTGLYTWVVREGATGWWGGNQPPRRLLQCYLWGAEYWRCQETLLSLDTNHRIGSNCQYIFLKEGEQVSSKRKSIMTLEVQFYVTQGKHILPVPVFWGKLL